jgi:hypothetical protein
MNSPVASTILMSLPIARADRIGLQSPCRWAGFRSDPDSPKPTAKLADADPYLADADPTQRAFATLLLLGGPTISPDLQTRVSGR